MVGSPEIPHCACFQGFLHFGPQLSRSWPCHAKNKLQNVAVSGLTLRHMPLHGPGQRIYWLPDKFYMPARKRATLLETRRKRRRAEEIFIQQCKENIAQGNIEQDIPNDQEEIFVPNKRARHRVPKIFSSANLTQKNKINPMFIKQQIIKQVNRIKRKEEYKSRNKEEKCPETKVSCSEEFQGISFL